jgi:hypothetical protein
MAIGVPLREARGAVLDLRLLEADVAFEIGDIDLGRLGIAGLHHRLSVIAGRPNYPALHHGHHVG